MEILMLELIDIHLHYILRLLMFFQIFFSPQVKQYSIITYKLGIYELPQELPNKLRFSEISKSSENPKTSYNDSTVNSPPAKYRLESNTDLKVICWRFHINTPLTFWDMRTRDGWKVCLQTLYLKLAYSLKNIQTSWANNSRIYIRTFSNLH